MRQGKPDGGDDAGKKAGPAKDGVDALVSGFLEELDGISSEVKETPHLETIEKEPFENPPASLALSKVPETARGIRIETGLDIEEIKKELEESLDELERLKAKVIPIADRKEARPEPPAISGTGIRAPGVMAATQPPPPPQTELNASAETSSHAPPEAAKAKMSLPAEAPAPKPASGLGPGGIPASRLPAVEARAKNSTPAGVRESEEQAWNRLELFRSQVASRRPFAWLKFAVWMVILACILGILAYAYFTRKSAAPAAADHAPSMPFGAAAQPSASDMEIPPDPFAAAETVRAQSIYEVKPAYPWWARVRGITGMVVIEADIGETGDVIRARAVSGPSSLRKSAEEAAMKWRFKPASANGVNIASRERISMVFRR